MEFTIKEESATEFTAENALLIAESGEDGTFLFENVPYGNWLIKELQPADGYLSNDEIYPVRISENGQTVGITVVNDRTPEIGTKATVNGEKTATAEGDITIEDTVSYKHLIPGKAYTIKPSAYSFDFILSRERTVYDRAGITNIQIRLCPRDFQKRPLSHMPGHDRTQERTAQDRQR